MGYKSLEVRMKPTVRGVGYLGSNLDLKSTHNGKLCKIYTGIGIVTKYIILIDIMTLTFCNNHCQHLFICEIYNVT